MELQNQSDDYPLLNVFTEPIGVGEVRFEPQTQRRVRIIERKDKENMSPLKESIGEQLKIKIEKHLTRNLEEMSTAPKEQEKNHKIQGKLVHQSSQRTFQTTVSTNFSNRQYVQTPLKKSKERRKENQGIGSVEIEALQSNRSRSVKKKQKKQIYSLIAQFNMREMQKNKMQREKKTVTKADQTKWGAVNKSVNTVESWEQ